MDNRPAQSSNKRLLYEQVAARITALIESGTYPPGERIPSVRELSRQQGVSISTVLNAYLLLENRGLVEARPQSGYYVRAHLPERLPEPEISSPSQDPTQVGLRELIMMVLRDTLNPELVQLGAAMPNINLMPVDKLNRLTASLARQAGQHTHQYLLPPGLEELRVQIAQRAVAAGCDLSPNEIVITSGGVEAIDLCLHAVCQPGDIVAIESPMYFGTLQSLEVHRLRALEIPTLNNPLGSCIPDEKKRDLVELLGRHEVPLIENDVSGELYFSDKRPLVVKAFDRKGLVMLCSSFSKDISPALRVGWVAPGRFRPVVEWLKFTNSAATATLPQMVVARFLESGGYDHHLRRIRREYDRNVALMSQAVMSHFPAGTRLTRPTGGFVLWVQLPEKVDSLELYKLALKEGITLTPGYVFSPTNQYRDFIRLNAADWSWPIERAIQRLGGLVEGMA
jgi:DNA-binding transcriptional MocR family regulator